MSAILFGFADVNGVRLHYARAGKGRLILFLHGFPEFWYAWKNQLAAFGGDFLAVAPDLRGYNLSSKPAAVEQYRLNILVEDVRSLAEHFGNEQFVLVGHDWGGVIAWAFAAQYPQKLDRLVIINAPHPAVFDRELRGNLAQQRASQYMLRFRSAGAEDFLSAGNYSILDENILQVGIRQRYFTEDDRQAYLVAWSQPGALTGGLNYYRAAEVGPPGEHGQACRPLSAQVCLLKVSVPTLVIWGEQDTALVPENLWGLDEFVPDLRIRRVPDCSHWVVHQEPDLVNLYLREFIETRF